MGPPPVPFPPPPADPLPTPAALAARGLALRAAADADLPWLRLLYAGTRADEFAPLPWPDAVKRAFLDQQCAAQHAHYLAHFADAQFLLLDGPGGPCGRLYLLRRAPEHRLVDISLLPEWRGRGIGGALVAAAQADAAALGRGLALHVAHANPGARRLYARLGFRADAAAESATHLAMRWRPAPLS
ncbi:GNAT family N-acetyltransferase [Luteimonas sp. RD2P54]|uniref:GNAT family N-acetyltransferase n=1 Tax=Luteimonas endophytica TaxID=3042023 RepID=A0ABT6J784_9GAMM|nr:GNAT family N-acetyltransferase [Luteimonas endophytica]MDH5822685.1 GNAT family N-acetyltransferase [Luteimonas endophytica]